MIKMGKSILFVINVLNSGATIRRSKMVIECDHAL